MSGFFLSRQKEMRDLQYQCSKLHKTFQRSESTLREMLGSLEETKEAGRNEVGEGIEEGIGVGRKEVGEGIGVGRRDKRLGRGWGGRGR